MGFDKLTKTKTVTKLLQVQSAKALLADHAQSEQRLGQVLYWINMSHAAFKPVSCV